MDKIKKVSHEKRMKTMHMASNITSKKSEGGVHLREREGEREKERERERERQRERDRERARERERERRRRRQLPRLGRCECGRA